MTYWLLSPDKINAEKKRLFKNLKQRFTRKLKPVPYYSTLTNCLDNTLLTIQEFINNYILKDTFQHSALLKTCSNYNLKKEVVLDKFLNQIDIAKTKNKKILSSTKYFVKGKDKRGRPIKIPKKIKYVCVSAINLKTEKVEQVKVCIDDVCLN